MTVVGNGQIILGNCEDVLDLVCSGTIALTVTSPPYDDLRAYNSVFSMKTIADSLYRVTKQGGVVVWNVGDQTKDGSETGSSFRQALAFMESGFLLADTMIYKKANPGGARGSNKTYIQCFEYMFVFSKGPLSTFNLIEDRPNKRAGVEKGGGRRNRDGSNAPTVTYEAKEFGRRFNVWEYPTQPDAFSARHPAPFPEALARDHIMSWSNDGDVVFDPFCGSGTTPLAAQKIGRRFLACDVSEEYVALAVERIRAVL